MGNNTHAAPARLQNRRGERGIKMTPKIKNYMFKKYDEYYMLYKHYLGKKTDVEAFHKGICYGIADTLITIGAISPLEHSMLLKKLI